MIVVQGQPDLPQVILTLAPPGRFPRRLHGRQQQRRQDRDDRDDDQQFDQRESTRCPAPMTKAPFFARSSAAWKPMPELNQATPSMSVEWATPLARDGAYGGTITKPLEAGRNENSPRTNAAAISWYIVNGWALSVTAFAFVAELGADAISAEVAARISKGESVEAIIQASQQAGVASQAIAALIVGGQSPAAVVPGPPPPRRQRAGPAGAVEGVVRLRGLIRADRVEPAEGQPQQDEPALDPPRLESGGIVDVGPGVFGQTLDVGCRPAGVRAKEA